MAAAAEAAARRARASCQRTNVSSSPAWRRRWAARGARPHTWTRWRRSCGRARGGCGQWGGARACGRRTAGMPTPTPRQPSIICLRANAHCEHHVCQRLDLARLLIPSPAPSPPPRS
eukprot:365088-Chlamydomonas_euryale.AAC.4